MRTQEEINRAWRVEYPSNVGPCTILTQPQQGDPSLRKPYQFRLNYEIFKQLKSGLGASLKPYAKGLQCDLIDTKALRYGARLHIFLLGYRPGLTGDTSGVTKEQWESVTGTLVTMLRGCLGDTVAPYVEPYTEDKKFQFRFDTYIQYLD